MKQESPPGYLGILCNGPEWAHSPEDLDRFNRIPPEAMTELQMYAVVLRETGQHPNNMVCLWFDEETRKCMHYDLRPDVCREEVVVGDESCLWWREQFGVDTGVKKL